MRIASLIVMLVIAGTARAQGSVNSGSNIFGGAPRQIVNVPIDTSKALSTANSAKALRMPSSQTNSPFNLSGIMPKFTMPSWPPKTPQTSVLAQKQNPFQPNPPKGAVNPFSYPTKKK